MLKKEEKYPYKTIWVSFMTILILLLRLTNLSQMITLNSIIWDSMTKVCIDLHYANEQFILQKNHLCQIYTNVSSLPPFASPTVGGLYILGPKQIYSTKGCQDYWWRPFILFGRWQAYRIWETKELLLSFIFKNSSLFPHPCFYWVC